MWWNTYGGYLESDVWQALRAKALERAHDACEVCGAYADLHVHHITYAESWGKEQLDDLAALCVECHDKVHELQDAGYSRCDSFRELLNRHARPEAKVHWRKIGPTWLRRSAVLKWLEALLCTSEPVPSKEVWTRSHELGFRKREMKWAKRKMGILSTRLDNVQCWMWPLP